MTRKIVAVVVGVLVAVLGNIVTDTILVPAFVGQNAQAVMGIIGGAFSGFAAVMIGSLIWLW